MTWLTAFAITQAVEVPVYLYAGRRLEAGRRWVSRPRRQRGDASRGVVRLSLADWLVGTLLHQRRDLRRVVEGALGLIAGIRHPWIWSLAANGASVCVGIAIQELGR